MENKNLEITEEDFRAIKDRAITLYKDKAFPVKVKRKNKIEVELDSKDFANYFLIQATLDFLKSKNLI